MKVVSVVGARPQFVKLAPVAQALANGRIKHVIIHTGQHYDPDMSDVFFQQLRIPTPDLHLNVGSALHGAQTGQMLSAIEPALLEHDPDWVVVFGDTNSTLAGAVAAVKLHIPVAHVEAGLRSFNRRMPEEHNRVLTDHAADLCLAPTECAMTHLEREGLGARSVLVGDVMTDVCYSVARAVTEAPFPIADIPSGSFVLATVHRAENTSDPRRLAHILRSLAALNVPVVLPVHPRLQHIAQRYGLSLSQGALRPRSPLSYSELIATMLRAQGVVTDSGGLQKEAYLLGKPCTTLRPETEWPETLRAGWNVLDPNGETLHETAVRPAPEADRGTPFGDGLAAVAVVRALSSSTSAPTPRSTAT